MVALNGAPVNGAAANGRFVLTPPHTLKTVDGEQARLANEIAAANERAAVARARAAALPPRAAIANLTLQLRTSRDEAAAAEARADAEATAASESIDADDAPGPLAGKGSWPPPLPPITLIIDAEAFGRALGAVLGEQLSVRGVDNATGPVGVPVPPAKLPMKHARHLDVFLIGVATLIVLVILAAWIG